MKRTQVSSLNPRKIPAQARSAATVEAILQAATQVLISSGFEKMSTTRIAERAGVSVGSFYQYFPNKRALLAALVHRHHRRDGLAARPRAPGRRPGPEIGGTGTARPLR